MYAVCTDGGTRPSDVELLILRKATYPSRAKVRRRAEALEAMPRHRKSERKFGIVNLDDLPAATRHDVIGHYDEMNVGCATP